MKLKISMTGISTRYHKKLGRWIRSLIQISKLQKPREILRHQLQRRIVLLPIVGCKDDSGVDVEEI